MKGVTSKAEAYALFKRLGVVPNLGYQAGSIADDIIEEAAEGIWGSGAVVQEMEKGARGKRWFTDGTTNKDGTKKVLTGSPGEIHGEEGIGGITAGERANVAKQVAEKTSSALGSDPDLVKKNLTRLQRYLKQAKLLAGVKPSANDAMIERLVQELEKLEGEALAKAIASRAGAIERALLDAWTDAHLLEQIAAKSGALNRALYGGMLESSGKWASVRGLLNDAEFKAFAKRQAFLAAIVLVWESPELYRKASKEGVTSAAAYATATLIAAAMPLTAHLLSMAAMWIAEAMVDYVAGYGYDAVVATQDCKDLLAGLYTVYGREAQVLKENLPRPSIEVQDLRAYYCRNAKLSDAQMNANLSTLVQAHAENACTRYADYKASTDANAAVALFNKCFPALQRLLFLEKQSAGYEARALVQQLKALDVGPYYDKSEAVLAKGKATVRVTAPFTADPETLEKDLATVLGCIGDKDKKPGVSYRYKWYAGQAQVGDKPLETTDGKQNARSYGFEKAGTYKVCVALETSITGISFELFLELKDTSVSRTPVCIDIEIREGGDKEPEDKDDKKDDKKNEQKPPPQVQPGAYTQPPGTQPSGQAGVQGGVGSQAGVQGGVSGQAGISAGVSGQAGITSGASGQTGVSTGTGGQTGITSGPSGQTGVSTGTGGQTGLASGVSGPAGVPTGTGSQAGITSGISTGTGVGLGSTPPACTYDYSAWGKCDRETKKWTRSVIAKKPVGCVETGQPVLEERCTPPPTEEELRNRYLNCLCRCSSGWGGHIGVWYDPENKTKPECKSSGPCIGGIGAFGCSSRHYFIAPNDCAKSCYEGVYGKGTYNEKIADKIRRDENKKFKEPLKLKINEKCPITAQLGDVITLTASVEGGIPPHTFSWSGNGQAKDKTFTFANSRQPGPHPISVSVTDDEGDTSTATCTVMVEALTVKIELLDKERNIPIGESRNFSGTVMAGDKPARGDFYFLWQPHPEILFSPFEKTGGNVSGTRAKFNKLGKFKVWVIAHTYKGNVKTTIGESQQIEIEVAKPEIKLSFQPQTPKVGQEVKLTATEKPKMDDKTIAFWWEISGNTLNPGPLKNEREYTFRPRDGKPVTVTVHGKARDGGDDLGQDKATITAQEYTVSLSEPKYMGSKPKIWKCDTQLGRAANCGLVEVTTELAVFHDIFIKAAVSPEPDKTPLRYAWSVDPAGVCGIPGGGQELKMNCSRTGAYTVKATVRDSQDIVLGTATTPVSITISQEDLNKAKGPLVTLTADKSALKTGESAVIKAAAQGGKAPYSYRWSGGVEGKGETVRFSPKKSGEAKITLEVTDAAGEKASADLSIKVEAQKLEVSITPDKPAPKVGEMVAIQARIKGGEPPLTFRWGAGVEGKDDAVRFVADKPGLHKVSLEVSDKGGQKASASVDLKVEAQKLEVSITPDKPALKVGERGTIQAKVKGGMHEYTYQWSSFVSGKGETATFTPTGTGVYKVWLEVRDKMGGKATASLDWKVEEGGDGQTAKTTGLPVTGQAGSSTAATSTIPASGVSTSVSPSLASLPILIMEPRSLSISPGKSADIRVFTVQNGRKVADVTDQCTLQAPSGSGVRIDRSGRVTLEKTARPGAVEPLLATLKHASGATLRADGIILIEGAATLASGGYNPNTDPGKTAPMKPEDADRVKKVVTEFQSGQWKPLETKEQKIKEQPAGQAQSPGYLSSSTTTAPTTVPPGVTIAPTTIPPGGTSAPTTVPYGVTTAPSTIRPGGTTAPTTVRPGGTTAATTAKPTTVKSTTTTAGVTPQNLTDVTVDRNDVTITVWDHGAEDVDIITIYLNGKVLKSNLKLTNKKQTFQVKLSQGQNRFEVEAVNEGSTPPNTATVEISNVTKGKPNQVYERKTGQRASMNLTAP